MEVVQRVRKLKTDAALYIRRHTLRFKTTPRIITHKHTNKNIESERAIDYEESLGQNLNYAILYFQGLNRHSKLCYYNSSVPL